MQKKLLAVAVAGALGAPALVMAQASTVQIYGRMYVEYSFGVDTGSVTAAGPPATPGLAAGTVLARETADFIQTPGSNIGFKGEEKLGGGLSAWFQCESTADPRGIGQDGFCSRNSALGMKGGFGNLFVGNWDAPFKRTGGPGLVGANQTGIFGSSFLMVGGSTTTAWPGAAAGSGASAGRGIFFRRQNSSVNYDSPNFGGFQVMAMFTASQASTATLEVANNSKPRIMSLGGQYRAGPIFIGAGYERHSDANGPTAAAGLPVGAGTARTGDDDGWHIAAAYTWGPVRFGGMYTRQEIEGGTVGVPTNVKYRNWHLGVDWKIVGPHGLLASYTRAADTKGTPGAAANVGSGVSRPGVPTLAALAAAPGAGDNGANLWTIRYAYSFSKRTQFTFGYSKLDNDTAGTYILGGIGGAAGAGTVNPGGQNMDAWAVALDHRF